MNFKGSCIPIIWEHEHISLGCPTVTALLEYVTALNTVSAEQLLDTYPIICSLDFVKAMFASPLVNRDAKMSPVNIGNSRFSFQISPCSNIAS